MTSVKLPPQAGEAKPMPKWPKYGDKRFMSYDPCGSLGDEVFDGEKFERARADYWEAVARRAVAVLLDVADNAHTLEEAIGYAGNAISDIGPLPTLPPEEKQT